MAEARREIVTALKYHRAAMKKAAAAAAAATSTGTSPQSPVEESSPVRSQEGKIKPRKIPKSSTTAERNRETPQSNFKCYNNNNLKNLCYDPSMMMMMNCSLPSWSSVEGNNNIVDIVLPEQTLGLNLNLQDFKNLDANLFSNSSVSVSGSTSTSIGRDQEQEGGGGGGGMHVAVGEEEMAEMRTIGEKHEMEWSDKMSMVKSAWWLRFMKMGKKQEEEDQEDQLEGFGYGYGDPFDQILEFPDWMNNGNENCFEEEQLMLNDYSQFFHHDHPSALPCMDIGEFEGMDGEWLA
ncbi:protein AF-9 [Cucumis melo var. makuwa]|uniref:Protein AF-9 n=1 Tax=Cucumis melo var. makuwa TaxID=1194695 RepID=A0A5A7TAT3_CUCMM|nr:protein AF-9 [Cucumis melo var. makuwa]